MNNSIRPVTSPNAKSNRGDRELDIVEIFEEVISTNNPRPNSYPLEFELDNLKELFEFLLQFVTMLCKHFYGDSNNQVNLSTLQPPDFQLIDSYMQSIGFSCKFDCVQATSSNMSNLDNRQYTKIQITTNTKLSELTFTMRCDRMLYCISFDKI
jgi:hypothetical protein